MNKGIIYGLIGFGGYALMDLNSKYSVAVLKLDFFTYLLYMSLVSAIILTVVGVMQNGYKVFWQIPQGVGKFIVLRSIIGTFGIIFSVAALARVPMHIFYPITLLAPMLATIFSCVFLGEKFSKRQMWILLWAFVGVLFVTKPWLVNNFSTQYMWGLIFSLLMMLVSATLTIISRVGLSRIKSIVPACYGAWAMGVFILIGYLGGFIKVTHVTTAHIPIIISGGLFYVFGAIFFLKGYGIGPIKKVAPTHYTQLMWGVLFDAIIFSNIASISELLGTVIIAFVNFLNIKKEN